MDVQHPLQFVLKLEVIPVYFLSSRLLPQRLHFIQLLFTLFATLTQLSGWIIPGSVSIKMMFVFIGACAHSVKNLCYTQVLYIK